MLRKSMTLVALFAMALGMSPRFVSGQQVPSPASPPSAGQNPSAPIKPNLSQPTTSQPTTGQPRISDSSRPTISEPARTGTQQPTTTEPTRTGTQQPTTPEPVRTGTQQPTTNEPIRTNTTQSSEQPRTQGQNSGDAQFITKATEIDLAEINLGRIALQRASNPTVRQFAQKMVQDHSMSLQTLNNMANRQSYKPAERMDKEHQDLMTKLIGLQGAEFDREYMTKMNEGHHKAHEFYKESAQKLQDQEMKSFAAKNEKIVSQHHEMAKQFVQGQTSQSNGQPVSNENRNDSVNPSRPSPAPAPAIRNDSNRVDPNPNREEKRRDQDR